jgi:hypothetical protein
VCLSINKDTINLIGFARRPSFEYNFAKASSKIFQSILFAKYTKDDCGLNALHNLQGFECKFQIPFIFYQPFLSPNYCQLWITGPF